MVSRTAHGRSTSTHRVVEDATRDARGGGDGLFLRYAGSRSTALRNRLVERYRNLVEAMAQGLAGRLPNSVDVQDLVQAGVSGLIQAIENFVPERGTHFLAFLRPRVYGAMLDELRQMDYLPRKHRRRLRQREAAVNRLRALLQREPSDSDVAAELGVSEVDLRRMYGSRLRTPPAPFARGRDAEEGGEAGDGMEQLADEAWVSPIDVLQRQDLVEQIVRSLQPVEWSVLRLLYFEGLTGKEVARRLRLSASRICQLHGRVLVKLKRLLGEG